jgi:anti-sigma B factor antagonist
MMAFQIKHQAVKDDAARDEIVVHFTGSKVSLDEETLYSVHDPLLALVDEPSQSDLLLDFANVDYLTSTALGTLVNLHKKLLARGRHMSVGNLSPQVHEVFAITRLDKFLSLQLAAQDGELASESARRRQERWIETPPKGA